jgi:putative ABC transport system permease protein
LLLGCIALVAVLVAGAGVSNAILMAVAERQPEIGTLRALGASRAGIFRLIWLETLQTCLSGSAVGVCAAFLASSTLEVWVRSKLPFSPKDAVLCWEWWLAGACIAGAAVAGSLASILPAWRAASVSPIISIRSGARA